MFSISQRSFVPKIVQICVDIFMGI